MRCPTLFFMKKTLLIIAIATALLSWGTGDVRQNRPPITPVIVYGNITTN